MSKFADFYSWKNILNENLSVDDYMNQLKTTEYVNVTKKLFNEIQDEGWLEQLEEFYNKSFDISNFKFTQLRLTDKDRNGLINFDDETVNKFNIFDTKLKSMDNYPYHVLDFIDYDKGIVLIVKFVN